MEKKRKIVREKKHCLSTLGVLLLILFLGLQGAIANPLVAKRTVRGKVTDTAGNALPFANVVVKGQTLGAVTDVDGTYILDVSDNENTVLVFSFIGYISKEIALGAKLELNVKLAEDVTGIEEVVAIGYGSQKKSDLTGALSSVKAEEIKKMPVATLDQTLMGRAAGVQVTSNSGEPGGGASIRIRGVGTVNNAEPLYVIDGIPISNSYSRNQTSISSINPADIASIEVLKDASALAIYGARAQNGVVLITTKKGKSGELSLNFETYSSVNILDRNVEMLSGPEWASYYKELINSAGLEIAGGDATTNQWIDEIIAGDIAPETYDWLDEGTRNGTNNTYQLSANGGNETSSFFLSGEYTEQKGIFKKNELKRYSLRLNTEHKINDWFKFGNTLSLSRKEVELNGSALNESNPYRYFYHLMGANPYKTIYNEDGYYAGTSDMAVPFLDYSPSHTIFLLNEGSNFVVNNRMIGSLFAEFKIIDGLVFKSMASTDLNLNRSTFHSPHNNIEGNAKVDVIAHILSKSSNESYTWYLDNTLTYTKSIKDHSFTALLGAQQQFSHNEGFGIRGTGLTSLDYIYFNYTTEDYISAGPHYENQNAWKSIFGRLLYDYQGKYLLTATVRRDGSSRFGKENQFGTFPAASLGWRVSEEDFMDDFSSISNLKLRASYGITGSEAAGDYQFIGDIGLGDSYNYAFGANENIVQGMTFRRLPNPYLKWEETVQANFGVDLGMFESRMNLTADYFIRSTQDMFLPFAPPMESGLEVNPRGNLGEVLNTGLEVTMNTVNIDKVLKWYTDFNFTILKNEVISLAGDDTPRYSGFGGNDGGVVNTTQVGGEIGALYGYEMDGIFQNWNEVYSHAYQNQKVISKDETNIVYDDTWDNGKANTAPGDVRFVDQNDDGIIDDQDRVVIGSTIPDFTWGLSNTLTYKGISLSVLIQGVHGVDIYNHLRRLQEGMKGSLPENQRKTILDRWTGEGTSNTMPRASYLDPNDNFRISSRYIENGSFIRVKNVRLSYELPKRVTESIGIGGIQIYGTGTNLFTITDYTGFDPEIGNRNASNTETANTDLGNYPLTRQFTLGLNVRF